MNRRRLLIAAAALPLAGSAGAQTTAKTLRIIAEAEGTLNVAVTSLALP